MKTKTKRPLTSPPISSDSSQSDILFDKQLRFIRDPAPFKTAVCSRRAGKTIACAVHILHSAIANTETVSFYITLSRTNAKKIIWPVLKKYNAQYRLGGIPNESDLSLYFPQKGSWVYLSGANDKLAIENFRGLPLKLVYIDECQSFPTYFQGLIDDVISPALMDYAGDLCLIGTPGPIPSGYFHSCAHSDNWSHHAWTFFDNPFIPKKSGKTHQALLERELKRRGVEVTDPTIQREWFGQWILDSDSLLVHYDKAKNDFTWDNPKTPHVFIMGIDLGFNDADAICVLAWNEKSPTTFLVEESVMPKQGITELVQEINRLSGKYQISKMVIDEGGLGKKIAEEIRRRHHVPVQAADKKRKMENIAFLNDALRTGRFMAGAKSRFAQDSYLVEIDRDKTKPDKIVVSDRYHSDIIDAVLYAFKESPGYCYEEPVKRSPKGTAEWSREEQDSMFEAAQDFFKKKDDDEGFGGL